MADRTRIDAGPLAGGIREDIDPSRLKPCELQEGLNCHNRKLALEKRFGFEKVQDVAGAVTEVRFGKQFIDREGTRFLLAGAGGTIYRIT